MRWHRFATAAVDADDDTDDNSGVANSKLTTVKTTQNPRFWLDMLIGIAALAYS
jgi:hypothetical protein